MKKFIIKMISLSFLAITYKGIAFHGGMMENCYVNKALFKEYCQNWRSLWSVYNEKYAKIVKPVVAKMQTINMSYIHKGIFQQGTWTNGIFSPAAIHAEPYKKYLAQINSLKSKIEQLKESIAQYAPSEVEQDQLRQEYASKGAFIRKEELYR